MSCLEGRSPHFSSSSAKFALGLPRKSGRRLQLRRLRILRCHPCVGLLVGADLFLRSGDHARVCRKGCCGEVLAEESGMNTVLMLIVLAAALVLAIGCAFLPMRLLMTHMANNIQQFILRQRERRTAGRNTTERRKEIGKPV